MTQRVSSEGCAYCEPDREILGPGFIEMDNNGPIVRCPVCSSESHGAEGELMEAEARQ